MPQRRAAGRVSTEVDGGLYSRSVAVLGVGVAVQCAVGVGPCISMQCEKRAEIRAAHDEITTKARAVISLENTHDMPWRDSHYTSTARLGDVVQPKDAR